MCIFVAQNHQQITLTHDGQQKAEKHFKITAPHIQELVSAKAITKGTRGLAQKQHVDRSHYILCNKYTAHTLPWTRVYYQCVATFA